MNRKSMLIAAALLMVGAIALVGVLGAPAVNAQGTTPGTITVLGYGEASGAPDVAYVTLGLEIRNEDVSTALAEAQSGMLAIMESLRGLDIPAEDIQTTDFSVWAEESYASEGPRVDAPTFFRVMNVVRVTLRNTDLMQPAIDAAVSAGANRIHGVSFGLDNPAALEADARVEALANARDRAQQIADALGVSLGEPIVVNEGGTAEMPFMLDAARGIGGGGSIQEGQLSVSVQTQVTYELVR